MYLKETGNATVELYVMGILKEFHRKGIGRRLFHHAKEVASEKGYSFIQVKTVCEGIYADYNLTNAFYQKIGFKELECMEELWDKANPCQVYVMAVK